MKTVFTIFLASLLVLGSAASFRRASLGSLNRPRATPSGPTIIASDAFTRNGGLNGTTLDNALGGSSTVTWSTSDDFYTSGGTLLNDQTGAGRTATLSTSAIADQTVQFSVVSGGLVCGVLARWSGAGGYAVLITSGGVLQLYENTSGTWTQLGSDGPSVSAGDTVLLSCVGTAIVVKHNGSSVISQTDSAHSSGVPGVYSGGAGTGKMDSFIFSTP